MSNRARRIRPARALAVTAVAAAAAAGVPFAAMQASGAGGDEPPDTSQPTDTSQPDDSNDSNESNGSDESDDRTYATVDRRDLEREETLDGTVSRRDATPLRLHGSGTVTVLPEVGQLVSTGQVLAEVDGEPVVLLYGTRPAWRMLGSGIDDGEDIRQLEEALVALGYADPTVFTPDDEWTSATTRAVKHLQYTLGLPEDGRLDLGEVVFAPSTTIRIAEVGADIGDPADGVVLQVTGEEQVVTTSLDAADVDLLAVDDEVEVELSTGEELAGRVAEIGAAEADDQGSVTLPVEIVVDGLSVPDGLPAEIHVPIVEATNVLSVPVEALLALAEGGYAVEVRDASSPTGTRLVRVDPGVFAEDRVEIEGEIAEGDEVVIP
jgi:Putative peptidoglycan binding domain